MKSSMIEISKKKAKAGRVPIKMILHEIHKSDDQYNKNGITWVKEYCRNSLDSIKGMQLVTQFADDERKVPFGDHGNMVIDGNRVIFEDSFVVGSFERGYIVENLEVKGRKIDAVVGEGYLYDQRCPALVDYLQSEYEKGNDIEGSVEIMAAAGNDRIIYDGGWKEKGRKPQIFEYSGHAIVIGTIPADDSALLLELNSYKNKASQEGGINLEELIREKDSKIESLTNQVAELISKIEELKNSELAKDTKIAELNSTIVEVNKELEALKAERLAMESEINSLREFKNNAELEAKKEEVNKYFYEEISRNGFTEAEINSLKVYVENIDLEGLKNAEAELCVQKYKELNNRQQVEKNSYSPINDLFVKTIEVSDSNADDIELAKTLLYQ